VYFISVEPNVELLGHVRYADKVSSQLGLVSVKILMLK